MIHQREQDSLGIPGDRAQATLQRSGHAAGIIRIDYESCGSNGAGANQGGVRAQHHDHGRAACREQRRSGVEKCFVAVWQQSFRRPHAPRFAGRENETCYAHLASTARTCSSANTDSESARQLDVAPRRTAIISAVTDIAISSGEMAPMSSPMGAWMFSNAARSRLPLQFPNHVDHLAFAADHGDVTRRRTDAELEYAHVVAMSARDDDQVAGLVDVELAERRLRTLRRAPRRLRGNVRGWRTFRGCPPPR